MWTRLEDRHYHARATKGTHRCQRKSEPARTKMRVKNSFSSEIADYWAIAYMGRRFPAARVRL